MKTATETSSRKRHPQPDVPSTNRCFRLNENFAWNPLLKYPRNKGCFCGSGKKAKACCIPELISAISRAAAEAIRTRWDLLLNGRLILRSNADGNQQFVDPSKERA